jgi:hypothetical protein
MQIVERNFDDDLVARPRRPSRQPSADRGPDTTNPPFVRIVRGSCRHDQTCGSLAETSAAISRTIHPAIGAPSPVMVPPRRADVRLGGSRPRAAWPNRSREALALSAAAAPDGKTQPSSRAEPEVQRTGPHRHLGPPGRSCRNLRADAAGPMGSARAACAGKFPLQVTLLIRPYKERDLRGEFLPPTCPLPPRLT